MKKKITVLHIILSKGYGYAGTEKYVYDLIRYQKKVHNVFVVTLKRNLILNKLLKHKVKVFYIGNFFKKIYINKIINNIKPEIIHTHLGEANKIVDKSNKYKIISTLHMNFKYREFKNCDCIITSNKTQFNEVKKFFKKKVFQLYLWTNLKKINEKKNILKKKLGIHKKNLIFGSIGRFHPQKGFDILIKVFTELNLPNCNLILIGNGHSNFKETQNKHPNIKIMGPVENVSNYFNLFNFAIFASRWESFGYTLVDAMNFKLPIITSIHNGNKDWLNKFNISKFEQNNHKKLKKLILKFYQNKEPKKKYDISMFDYKKNCAAVSRIYQKILVT